MNPSNLSQLLSGEWIATAALLFIVIATRGLVARAIRDSELVPEERLRWLVQLRTGAVATLLFGLVVIWAEELRTVALSLVAVAVALTIGTKELLLCLSGALVRASSGSFSIGDRIQVGSLRGDVIDLGALTTRLLEVDDETSRRTGRSVTIPNSKFVDTAVVNESFAASFALNVMAVPVAKDADWRAAEEALNQAALEMCAPFLHEAKAHIKSASHLEILDAPVVDPTVSLLLLSADEIRLQLRFPAPVRRTHRVAQAILRRYLELRPPPPKVDKVEDPSDRPDASSANVAQDP